MATRNEEVCEKLNDLIQLDFDAIEAYEAAIERLDSSEYRTQLQMFMRDHERHTVNLAEQVRMLGGTPATKADFMRVLTKGKVVIGALGDDKGVLMAMNANEAVTNKTYEHMVKALADHPAVDAVVRGNLADERRHKAWIEETLEAIKSGASVHPQARGTDTTARPGSGRVL